MGLLSDSYYQDKLKPPVLPAAPSLVPPPPPPEKGQVPALISPTSSTTAGTTPATPTVEQEYLKQYGTPFLMNLGNAFGLQLPNKYEWDQLSFAEKSSEVVAGAVTAATRLVLNLPKEIVKAPVRVLGSVYQAWDNYSKGKGILEPEDKPLNLPVLGEIPTYWKSQQEALDSGVGPLAATLMTTGLALGDVTIASSLFKGVTATFQPKGKLLPGEQVTNTVPIQQALIEEQGKMKIFKKPESANEYYDVPKTTAKEFGGGNVKMKVSPADDGAVEVSFVQLVGSGKKKGATQGDFGFEIKLQSEVVPLKGAPAAALSEEALIEQQKQISIPAKATPGFENKPITPAQLGQLDLIAQVNGIKPGIRGSVVNALTGKQAIGDLTQSEFVNVAQTLGLMSKADKYSPSYSIFSYERPGKYLSPRRYYARAVEESTGVPLASQVEIPLENAGRTIKIIQETHFNKIADDYGKYYDDPNAGKLVNEYLRGNKEVITQNADLSDAVKADLIAIADKRRAWYNETGEALGVPKDVYLQDYTPNIANIGGVYQLYKEGSKIPENLTFFAKQKRRGGLSPLINDERALAQIYVKAGARTKFYGPIMEKSAELAKDLPPSLQSWIKNTVQEKLGYEGKLEEYLNGLADGLNNQLGWNLPPDLARQTSQFLLTASYVNAMGFRPGTYFRNLISNPVLSYVDRGPRFLGEATAKALSKEGVKEVADKGFLVEMGVPYGDALVNESAINTATGAYKKFANVALKGQELTDTFGRSLAYWQTKLQFDDVVGRYNAGKLRWNEVENELGFSGLSPIDRQVIRGELTKGNLDGARDHLIRMTIDNTQFPYRRGTAMPLADGLAGKIGFQFTTWSNEYLHYMGSLVRRGQYDKMIRWFAATSAINRSLQASGVDFSSSLGIGPAFPQASPAMKTALEIYDGINAWRNNNDQELDRNADLIVRRAIALNAPLGANIVAWNDFLRSYKKGQVGPNGEYGVYDSKGKLKSYATFSEIWWKAWGFPSANLNEQTTLQREIQNSKFNYSRLKQQALQLYQEGKNEEANAIVEKNNIAITPHDFDQFYIPLNQRTFNSLPAALKAQFAPRVFPGVK